MTDPPPFRFSKFYLRTLFDGHVHLVKRGENYPADWSREEVSKKLRGAAWWRNTTLQLTHCPDGVWVQSPGGVDPEQDLRQQLARATETITRLKEHNAQLRKELWELKNQ